MKERSEVYERQFMAHMEEKWGSLGWTFLRWEERKRVPPVYISLVKRETVDMSFIRPSGRRLNER